MKRTYTLLVLLGLVVGSLLTGCTPSETKPVDTSTNAAPPPTTAPASTNK